MIGIWNLEFHFEQWTINAIWWRGGLFGICLLALTFPISYV